MNKFLHFMVNTFFFSHDAFHSWNLSLCFSLAFRLPFIFKRIKLYCTFVRTNMTIFLRQPAQGLVVLSIAISHHHHHHHHTRPMYEIHLTWLVSYSIGKSIKWKREEGKRGIPRRKDNTFELNGTISHFFWAINWKCWDFLCMPRGNLHL